MFQHIFESVNFVIIFCSIYLKLKIFNPKNSTVNPLKDCDLYHICPCRCTSGIEAVSPSLPCSPDSDYQVSPTLSSSPVFTPPPTPSPLPDTPVPVSKPISVTVVTTGKVCGNVCKCLCIVLIVLQNSFITADT